MLSFFKRRSTEPAAPAETPAKRPRLSPEPASAPKAARPICPGSGLRIFHGAARQSAQEPGKDAAVSWGSACVAVDEEGRLFFGLSFLKQHRNPAPQWCASGKLTEGEDGEFKWGSARVSVKFSEEEVVMQLEHAALAAANRRLDKVKVQGKLELLRDAQSDPTERLRQDARRLKGELAAFAEKLPPLVEPGGKGRCARLLGGLAARVAVLREGMNGEEPQKVCIIGATGTGKSSLVNALLGWRVAQTAGSGKAVTHVPTEYFRGEVPETAMEARLESDVVGATLKGMALQEAPKPRFVVGLEFLRGSDMKKLVIECCEDLASPAVTKTEKERDCLPLLQTLFTKEAYEALLQRHAALEISPTCPEHVCAAVKMALTADLLALMETEQRQWTWHELVVKKPPAVLLQGALVATPAFTLDALRGLEAHYWQVLHHVEVGSPRFSLLEVPEAGAGVRLVDVPGFGDACGLREKISERYLDLADQVLVCAACTRAGSDRYTKEYLGRDALQELQMKRVGTSSVFFCATKSDQTSLKELQDAEPFEEDATSLRAMHRETVRSNVRGMLEDFKYGHDMPIAVLSAEKYIGGCGSDGFTTEGTEVPFLARLVFKACWEASAQPWTLLLQGLRQACLDALEDLERQARHGAAEKQASDAADIAEVVRSAVEKATKELAVGKALRPFFEGLDDLEAAICTAAQACDRASGAISRGWDALHWSTYRATLAKHGEHTGVKGKQDFNADVFRRFREVVQERGWSRFFQHARNHLKAFGEELADSWARFAGSVVREIEQAEALPREERQTVAREVQRSAQRRSGGVVMQAELQVVREATKALQERLDQPKEALKMAIGPEYCAIANGEAGTGSHARRKERVHALLHDGCSMEQHTAALLADCGEVRGGAEKLPCAATKELQGQAQQLAQGSWSVDSACPMSAVEEEEAMARREAADAPDAVAAAQLKAAAVLAAVESLLSGRRL